MSSEIMPSWLQCSCETFICDYSLIVLLLPFITDLDFAGCFITIAMILIPLWDWKENADFHKQNSDRILRNCIIDFGHGIKVHQTKKPMAYRSGLFLL